jgi:glycosyltransferase involved in cell wall biosynthesis
MFVILCAGIGEYIVDPRPQPAVSISTGRNSSHENAQKSPSLFDIGSNAVVVNSAHQQAVAEAVLSLIKNPSLAQQIGRNARQSLIRHFSFERQIAQYEVLYESLRMFEIER